MRSEPDVIGFDAQLLAEVMESHPLLTAKRLAWLTERHVSTIHRYLSGEKTIPVGVFRTAFEETADLRLVTLISGRRPVAVLRSSGGDDDGASPRIPPVHELMPAVCDAVKKTAAGCDLMSRIVSDGAVDESDAAAIRGFRACSARAREQLSVLDAALEAHLRRTGANA